MSGHLLLVVSLVAGCIGGSTKDDPTDTGHTGNALEACALAADSRTCPECSSGDMTCTYGDVSVTVGSCGDCQSRSGLYQALCDAGVTDDRATIEADTVCEPPACVVAYDTCYDPCEPLCMAENLVGDVDTSCDLGCTSPVDRGECVNNGYGCAFE